VGEAVRRIRDATEEEEEEVEEEVESWLER